MFFSLSSTLTPCSISVKVVCLLCVCTSVKLYVCVCVFKSWLQRRGATLAPPELSTHLMLLGLQVKAEYIYFSVPHPPTHVAFILCSLTRFSFYVLFSAKPFLLYYLSACFFYLVHQPPCFYFLCFILLQDVEPSSGIACFRPLTTILPFFVFFILAPHLFCKDPNMFFLCVFCQSYFSPPAAPAMSPNKSSHQLTGLAHGKCSVCVSVRVLPKVIF